MKISYPNQNIITIQKDKVRNDFLQVNNEDWMTAYKNLSASGFAFYLYLASNMDGFELALSKVYVMEKLGISEGTYKKLVPELESKGYLVRTASTRLTFRTSLV